MTFSIEYAIMYKNKPQQMKKFIAISAMIFFVAFSEKATAQNKKDTIQVKVGFTLVPQGSMSLENPGKFTTYTNVFGGVTTIKGKWFNTTFYSMTFNQVGTAFGYYFTPDFLMYIVGCKTTIANKDYVGLGVGTPLANGRATGFAEVGSGTKNFKPGLYVGMFIPFTRKIK